MAVWRADPKRRGQFVAGHARLQRWIFRLEVPEDLITTALALEIQRVP
jgi:hypothetical protein